ncbi:hypothetical protein GF351_04505 [Candidatus Woesearchaeota archaeon]|nr:hypothetical protein [Candidatus Woesearchaeota archaeon]
MKIAETHNTAKRMGNVNITMQEEGDLIVDIADPVRLNDLVDAAADSLPDVSATQRVDAYDTDTSLFLVYAMGNASELYRCKMECALPVKGIFVRAMRVEQSGGRPLRQYEIENMAARIGGLEPAEKQGPERLLSRYCSQSR